MPRALTLTVRLEEDVSPELLQGIGGALLTPGSLAMIQSGFRPGDRAHAIGAWSGLGGVAAALGPLLGGFLVDAVSWRAIFLINLPIGIFVVAAARRHVPETPRSHRRRSARPARRGAGGARPRRHHLRPHRGTRAGHRAGDRPDGRRGESSRWSPSCSSRAQPEPDDAADHAAWPASSSCSVAFLQISLGYSPIAAGAASLPVTALMLSLSARSGTLAQQIGPRIPLTVGPFVIAAGMLLMTRIDPGDSYVSSVLPAVVVFGLGLTLVVAPVTATVLAAADSRHAGTASGINSAVSQVAGLLAVAVLPLISGLTGDSFYDRAAMADGLRVAMLACAVLAAAGGILAWLTIRDDVLEAEPELRGEPPVTVPTHFSCAVAGPPLRPASEPGHTSGRPAAAAR